MRYLDHQWPLADDAIETVRQGYVDLFVPLLLNSSLAAIRSPSKSTAFAAIAVANTTRAINQFAQAMKPADHAKALYRRALARVQLKDEEEAEEDLRTAAKLAPEDKAIASELAKIKEAQREHKEKQKKAFKKMFS